MKLPYLSMLTLAVMLLAGCQLELPPAPLGNTTPLNAPFTLNMGQSIAVAGEPATIRLEAWVDDKRCPSTLECAESGPVKVQLTLWREGRSMTYPVFSVHTDETGVVLADAPDNEREKKIGPFRITLSAVTPYPTGTQPLAIGDYQATLVVNKDPTALPDTDADMNVITDQPFTLAPGELVTLVGREVALRVASVADARCPVGQDCAAQNGAVEVLLDWLENGAPLRQVRLSAFTDESGAALPAAGTLRPFELVDGVGIRLVRVEPHPATQPATAQRDYRVTLMLEPGPRMPNGTEFAATGDAFNLTPDRTAVIGQDELRVRFDAIVEDSRCPRQVLCVRTGAVQVAVTVSGQLQRATTYLLGGATDDQGQLFEPATIVHDGYTLHLTQVTPYPEQPDAPITADAYVATFVAQTPATAASTPASAQPVTAAPDTPDLSATLLLPLLCINDFALVRMAAGVPPEPAIQFTAALAQDAATDYGEAHALCNKTFGPEWVQAGPSDLADFVAYLPNEQDFWIWDGMAGSLVRYEP